MTVTGLFIEAAIGSAIDDCIIWPYACDGDGYPHVGRKRRWPKVARIVCTAVYGPPPPGALAAHAPLVCHNRRCINPRHLRWATPTENRADRMADGTASTSPTRKLTAADAVAIRALWVEGMSGRSLAARYGVNTRTIRHVIAGRTWRDAA